MYWNNYKGSVAKSLRVFELYKQSPTQIIRFQAWFDTKMILLEYRERDNRATVLSRNKDDFFGNFNVFYPHSMVAR